MFKFALTADQLQNEGNTCPIGLADKFKLDEGREMGAVSPYLPKYHGLADIDPALMLLEQQKLGQGSQKLVRDTRERSEIILYDLAGDPDEERNVADKHPKQVKAMPAVFEAWQEDVTSAVTAEQKTR